jgi:hypothetical protein
MPKRLTTSSIVARWIPGGKFPNSSKSDSIRPSFHRKCLWGKIPVLCRTADTAQDRRTRVHPADTKLGDLGFEPSFPRSTSHWTDAVLTLQNADLQAFTIQPALDCIVFALG